MLLNPENFSNRRAQCSYLQLKKSPCSGFLEQEGSDIGKRATRTNPLYNSEPLLVYNWEL